MDNALGSTIFAQVCIQWTLEVQSSYNKTYKLSTRQLAVTVPQPMPTVQEQPRCVTCKSGVHSAILTNAKGDIVYGSTNASVYTVQATDGKYKYAFARALT
jgi:PP-loop superfamily ATP-utilizing enzyme